MILKGLEVWTVYQRPHRRNTWQCRMETLKTDRAMWTINCWWCEHINEERRWVDIQSQLVCFSLISTQTELLCTGPWPHRRGEQMASHFHSSLINCETNFGLNVSENSLRHLMLWQDMNSCKGKKKKDKYRATHSWRNMVYYRIKWTLPPPVALGPHRGTNVAP